jgi:hypothetical protein
MSLLHDTSHSIHFALPPCYATSEMILHLPCEPGLWNARTSREWYALLNEPSPYGSTRERLMGAPVQDALNKLRHSRVPTPKLNLVLSPQAHLILMKVCLHEIYALASPLDVEPVSEKQKEQKVFEIQYYLHNWLGSWLASPDTPLGQPEPTFYHNALPVYWLCQISLMAYQEDLPPFQLGSASRADSDQRFKLVNWWGRCTRKFLRKARKEGTMGDSTFVWNEMMKIRLDAWKFEMQGDTAFADHRDGCLDLFGNIGSRDAS